MKKIFLLCYLILNCEILFSQAFFDRSFSFNDDFVEYAISACVDTDTSIMILANKEGNLFLTAKVGRSGALLQHNIYGQDNPYVTSPQSIIKLDNNYLVCLESGEIMSTNDSGEIIWEDKIEDVALRKILPDGQNFTVGGLISKPIYDSLQNRWIPNFNFLIRGYNQQNDIVFEYEKNFSESDQLSDLIRSKDNGWIAVGSCYNDDFPSDCLVKVDSLGNEVFASVYPNSDGYKYGISVAEGDDKSVLITGYRRIPEESRFGWYVAKFDSLGVPVWTKDVRFDTERSSEGVKIIKSMNNYFYVLGNRLTEDGRKLALLKIDDSGNISMKKSYEDPNVGFGYDIIELSSNEIAIVGQVERKYSTYNGEMYLILADSLGQFEVDRSSFQATQNADFDKMVKIYPNPTYTDEIRIETLNNSLIEKIEVFSITGKLIQTHEVQVCSFQLNIPNLTNSVYLIRLTDSFGNTTLKKIVKAKKNG